MYDVPAPIKDTQGQSIQKNAQAIQTPIHWEGVCSYNEYIS